ncbi:MAG: nicotinate-nucleotide--dimethylbenzimidazole phosphoribosyltransferase [Aquabacterium sp.]|nr:MAG: nicotinate-nucleotide--dimethylbenzimidazole phosphoribosyltransferase [Aquabacterium sp.]
MSSVQGSPISPTAHPALERALREKLLRRSETAGSLGELEPLAVRLGLIQGNLKPSLREPQMLVFAGDHGFVVDRILPPSRSTATQVRELLEARLPLPVFCRIQGVALNVIDAGVAEALPAHAGLMARKIAHGTRNTRVGQAMTLSQAHAAIRAGMEIADTLPGNLLAVAGVGEGAFEASALIIARLGDGTVSLRQLLATPTLLAQQDLSRQLVVLQGAQGRHKAVEDPVEVMAAFGGYEVAMMVGALLVAASKRSLIVIDGLPACAALLVASRIAPAVLDYCVFSRSHPHPGLTAALKLFEATALLEMGMSSTDGTGAVLAWPLINSAAALLTEVAEGELPGETYPAELDDALIVGQDAAESAGDHVELPVEALGASNLGVTIEPPQAPREAMDTQR